MKLGEQPFLIGDGVWFEVRDGNYTARSIFDRHYSRHHYKDGRNQDRFVGPGERMVLLTRDADALLVWKKFISKDAQEGVSCSIFRNESPALASELLKAGMDAAWTRWPGQRLYTYVNPREVRSANPGYCFKRAGWRLCGVTKARKLLILECVPEAEPIAGLHSEPLLKDKKASASMNSLPVPLSPL